MTLDRSQRTEKKDLWRSLNYNRKLVGRLFEHTVFQELRNLATGRGHEILTRAEMWSKCRGDNSYVAKWWKEPTNE